ncbi:ScyD/ScyE family protein [Cryobacterium sp. PH31-AA6]|uniref:ScyD/ScyE family protein n=1 Tax=Cryobacterium sp. PH31-AA6 TaxID=3046205 RepID=UPI0024BA8805|nr:ScyD/ScyE family protein [Cryobacterium sp. PH31-AA6]MDJ0322408.1 ScyD/ScyE family protein [Cryobacterium sp. PH31-AA6]
MFAKRTITLAALLAALVIPSVLSPTVAGATTTHQGASATLLVSGLQGTTGGTIGPDGALYVTENVLGTVTRIDPKTGATSTFASGLPKTVIGIAGPIDVAFIGNTAYVLVSVVGPEVGGTNVDGIYRIDSPTTFTVIADLGAFSRAHPPATDFFLASGVQFAFQPFRGGFLVTDGHHNRMLSVKLDGTVTELIAFENIVPTGLAVSGKTIYMAEAGPVPHLPATGKVVSFSAKNPVATDVASGYSLIVDVAVSKCGTVYALSQGDSPGQVPAGSPALPNSGELLRVNADGVFSVVADALNLPTSVVFSEDTALVVTLNGEVWTVPVGSGRDQGKGDDCRDNNHGEHNEGK